MEAAEFAVWGRMSALEAHAHLTVSSVCPVTVEVAIAVTAAIAVAVAGATVAWPAVALSTAPLTLCGLPESTTGPST